MLYVVVALILFYFAFNSKTIFRPSHLILLQKESIPMLSPFHPKLYFPENHSDTEYKRIDMGEKPLECAAARQHGRDITPGEGDFSSGRIP